MTQFKFAIVAGACKRALAALQAFLNPCPPPADAFRRLRAPATALFCPALVPVVTR